MCIVLIIVCLSLILPVYASEATSDIQMYTVRYPSDAIVGNEYIIFTEVGFKDFVTYYPFLYPGMKSKPHTFDVALLDNRVLHDLKTVTFYNTKLDDPDSLRKDVDFVWTPSGSGEHNLVIVFDYSNKVPEIREDNNVFSFSIYVFPTRLDRYMKFVRMNKFLLIFACLYLVFVVLYLVYKKRAFD